MASFRIPTPSPELEGICASEVSSSFNHGVPMVNDDIGDPMSFEESSPTKWASGMRGGWWLFVNCKRNVTLHGVSIQPTYNFSNLRLAISCGKFGFFWGDLPWIPIISGALGIQMWSSLLVLWSISIVSSLGFSRDGTVCCIGTTGGVKKSKGKHGGSGWYPVFVYHVFFKQWYVLIHLIQVVTLFETNIAPEKKCTSFMWDGLFSGAMFVSARVYLYLELLKYWTSTAWLYKS